VSKIYDGKLLFAQHAFFYRSILWQMRNVLNLDSQCESHRELSKFIAVIDLAITSCDRNPPRGRDKLATVINRLHV